jgi:hypothetical protein
MPEPTAPADVRCPRCGYDLRGTVTLWRQDCPMTGTCTECGLEFEWAELLNPRLVLPPWCVEAARPVARLPGQILGTLGRSALPWRFWSSLRMFHVGRWPRLLAYLAVLAALSYVVFAFAHGWTVWQRWQVVIGGGYTPTTGGGPVFWQAVALPWTNQAVGSFTSVMGAWAYETPREVFRYTWSGLFLTLLTAVIAHACCGMTFAALPITRRRCKVRWAHIVRVTLYGFVLVLPGLAFSLPAVPMTMSRTGAGDLVAFLATAALGAIPFMEVAWWTAATSRYLRMPHAWGVGIAVTVVGGLASMALMSWSWAIGNPGY